MKARAMQPRTRRAGIWLRVGKYSPHQPEQRAARGVLAFHRWLILGGQCPRGSDVAWPPQGSAQARRRSGPPVALALGEGAALAALTSGPGARQRARPPACTCALPCKDLPFLQVDGAQGASRSRRRWRRQRWFTSSSTGSANATGPAGRPRMGSRQQQAPVNRGHRDSGLHFLHQVFCAHRMR